MGHGCLKVLTNRKLILWLHLPSKTQTIPDWLKLAQVFLHLGLLPTWSPAKLQASWSFFWSYSYFSKVSFLFARPSRSGRMRISSFPKPCCVFGGSTYIRKSGTINRR